MDIVHVEDEGEGRAWIWQPKLGVPAAAQGTPRWLCGLRQNFSRPCSLVCSSVYVSGHVHAVLLPSQV